MDVGAVKGPTIRRGQVMKAITTIGLDIAKSVFQVHGVDAEGNVVLRQQLKRRYVVALFQNAAIVPSWYCERRTSAWLGRPLFSITSVQFARET